MGLIRTPKNERLRQRSRDFVTAGLLSPAEAAKVAGISKALMHAWTKDIEWRAARLKNIKRVRRSRYPGKIVREIGDHD